MHVGQVLQAQVVPHVQSQAKRLGLFAGTDKGGDGRLTVLGIHRSVRFGVQFHAVGTGTGCIFHHLLVGIHEYAHPDALLVEAVRHLRKEVLIALGIPPMVTRQLLRAIGHQRHLCRYDLQHQIHKLRGRIALDVKLRCQARTQVKDVLPTYVALIGTWMYSDALGTEPLAIQCHLHHIRIVAATRIAQCGYFVDINTQIRHSRINIFTKLRNYS